MFVGHFLKTEKRIQKLKEKRVSGNIFWSILGKTCLQQDMADRDFGDLPRKTTSEKFLNNNVFNIDKKSATCVKICSFVKRMQKPTIKKVYPSFKATFSVLVLEIYY